MKKLFISTAILALLASCNNKDSKNENTNNEAKTETTVSNEKIVSLNGAITEVLADLGEQNNLVGVDVTSTYPASVKEKAQDLGHVRSLSIEALLALKPTKVYATDKDLNPEQIAQLKNAGIQTEIIKQDYSVEGTKELVKTVATSLNKQDFDAITSKIDNDLKALKPLATKPKVLFIYARGAGNLMVAGTNTPMEKIIGIAGGQNAITEFEDFKPLTPEAVVKANPDYILMFDKGLESIGGIDGVIKLEGVASTNAGKNKKIIAMDGQLVSGFGPRVGQAASQLNQLLQK
ncbi:heme/hemin ABC transporter substrate-binding protein [Empedobacter tilapiae]|uniref:Hemin ABC transporter substrate-binding protein n=1 Tax=Empedobacter tilapiae TaxID=2491114 RepID=A0A4Z1BHY6_9FLAO|nr:ABC transporter substrate-binding protein [Empedobacter tilapiae]TGN24589.1 hemin ABC transporter substrate-binding protein [Empedobacter tilapiae]